MGEDQYIRRPVKATFGQQARAQIRIQRRVDGAWVDHNVGWFCGTGLRHCVIPSGQSSVLSVYAKDEMFPLRVGVAYAGGKATETSAEVWTERIELPE